MAKEHILFDKTEIMCVVFFGNRASMMNVKYSDIINVTIRPFQEKAMFGSKPSEKIEIKMKNSQIPITYTKLKEKGFWDSYKTNLQKFCKDNRITFVDETVAQ